MNVNSLDEFPTATYFVHYSPSEYAAFKPAPKAVFIEVVRLIVELAR